MLLKNFYCCFSRLILVDLIQNSCWVEITTKQETNKMALRWEEVLREIYVHLSYLFCKFLDGRHVFMVLILPLQRELS